MPNGWINTDFTKTNSYSNKLIEHSVHYRTYSNIVDIRTIKAEYLIAMKLMAGRKYKKDLSDIVGILNEQQKTKRSYHFRDDRQGSHRIVFRMEKIETDNVDFLKSVLKEENLENLFAEVMQEELESKSTILEINKNYPDLVKPDNINEILEKARKEKDKK